jgi:hypothetical protein
MWRRRQDWPSGTDLPTLDQRRRRSIADFPGIVNFYYANTTPAINSASDRLTRSAQFG